VIIFSVIGPTGAEIWPFKGLGKNLFYELQNEGTVAKAKAATKKEKCHFSDHFFKTNNDNHKASFKH
jgi:hypothetical protein